MFSVKQFISKVGPMVFPTFERDISTEDGTITVQAGGTGYRKGICDGCKMADECDDKMPDDTTALIRLTFPDSRIFFDIKKNEDRERQDILLYPIGSESTVALREALEFVVQALKDAEDGKNDEAAFSGDPGDHLTLVWQNGKREIEKELMREDMECYEPDDTKCDPQQKDSFGNRSAVRFTPSGEEDVTHGYAD